MRSARHVTWQRRPESPRLTPRRERELVCTAQDGDAAARECLVEAFMPLIGGAARKHRGSSAVDRAELMQEGVVGLLRALERYDVELGTPFWAYASWWVHQAMQKLVAEMTRPVVLSDRALRGLARVKGARRQYAQDHGGEPSPAELAMMTGVPRDQVEQLMAVERPPRGLDEPFSGDEGTSSSLGERVADPVGEDEYERVDASAGVEALSDGLPGDLCERERNVVRAHFGLDRPAETLREIAGELGVSVERVRQIEERALEKLREALVAGPMALGAVRPARR
jgi:RNA polymerase primary sigma factor